MIFFKIPGKSKAKNKKDEATIVKASEEKPEQPAPLKVENDTPEDTEAHKYITTTSTVPAAASPALGSKAASVEPETPATGNSITFERFGIFLKIDFFGKQLLFEPFK